MANTVATALALCGVDTDMNNIIFNGSTTSVRIANEIFDDSFDTFMDITFEELDDHWKTYATLTVADGKVRLRPPTKSNIKALVQWVRDRVRMSLSPSTIAFPVNNKAALIKRYHTHKQWVRDAKNMLETALPKSFTEKMKWTDWKTTLIGFLRTQPGRNGVPLSYIVRDNANPITTRTNADFLDDYVDQAPLTGTAFIMDRLKVHTLIVRFISEHTVAEQKILPFKDQADGRVDFMALKDYYEGVGANSKLLHAAEKDIQELFYLGEKYPSMWWDEFETRFTNALATIDKDAGRAVYTNDAKLRMLNNKIRADFLLTMKTSIDMEMNKVPMTMTFEGAMRNYRYTVQAKFPDDPKAHKKRKIQATNTQLKTGKGKGNNSNKKQNTGGKHSGRHSGGSNRTNSHKDSWTVLGNDGKKIDVHPSFQWDSQDWFNIPKPVRIQLTQMRNEYRAQKNQQRMMSEANTYYDRSYQSQQSWVPPPNMPPPPPTFINVPPPPPPPPTHSIGQVQMQRGNMVTDSDNASRASSASSQSTWTPRYNGSLMGGRNEQANMRSRGRYSGNVISKARTVCQSITKMPEPKPNVTAMNEADTNADTCCLGTNFIPLSYTNRAADVYPYHGEYKPLENVPIVTAATAYDHPNGETYILVINEALYYGTKMDHSLINPNQIRFNGLDFYDNPVRDEELKMQIDDDLYLPLRFKGTKCLFESRSPTRDELNQCVHLHLTSNKEWEPDEVDLRSLYKISAVNKASRRNVFKVTTDTVYSNMSPTSFDTHEVCEYADPTSDEAILSEISPSLVQFKEMVVKSVTVQQHPNEVIPGKRSFVNKDRHTPLSTESLSEKWFIGPKRAQDTLRATTQRGIRSAILPISRRYRADRFYDVKRLRCKMATDTLFSPVKSLHKNTCAQIFSTKFGFSVCYPQANTKGETIGTALENFVHDFGAPAHLTFDGYSSQVGGNTKFQKTLRHYSIPYHISAPRRPNENPAEGSIREIKRRYYRVKHSKKVPDRIWDYLMNWISDTGNLSVSSSKYANGRTSIEILTGDTPDISEYVDFSFYDWVSFRQNAGMGEIEIGRWIGVSHKVGQLMSYWILPISGIPISCVTVQRLTDAEMNTDAMKPRMQDFDLAIKKKFDVLDANVPMPPNMPDWNRLSHDEDDPAFADMFQKPIDDPGVPHADHDESAYSLTHDNYLNMEIGLPRGEDGNVLHATVKRRAVDVDGRPIGRPSNNPITDSRLYDVEFLDGTMETISANIIAENLLSQVDSEGHRQLMLDEIIDHRKCDNAISKADAFYTTHTGIRRRKQTTRGWQMCVQWKDGSSQWIEMKDLKNSYPIELAEYSINNKIHDEPAFAWWVPHTIKKRNYMIGKVKSKYWQRTHKYGLRLPKSVKEAYEIDDENQDSMWADAIKDEMPKIINATEVHEGKEQVLIDDGFKRITGHVIFDIKLGENFRRKARFVADGHKTDTPAAITYSSVVSRDSVRIVLTLAALNDLDILAADVEHAYLTAPCREKCYLIAGQEFGKLQGSILIVRKALYGLKSSGAAFRAYLADHLDRLGWRSTLGDPDVWIRPSVKPDGERYYEYLLVYVDDLMLASHNPLESMRQIGGLAKFKNDKIEPPDFYLGAKICKKDLNGQHVWTMTSTDYVKAAVENVEKQLKKRNMKLPSRAPTPMAQGFAPELDSSPELNSDDLTLYQEMIGVLRWAVEIGRVDILTELSMLSPYQASPRQGHLEQVYHIFAYLKYKPKLTLYFDPKHPPIDPIWFANGDDNSLFREHYRDAEEQLPPPNLIPEPLGRSISMTAYVDASHAANKVTRRSHTGFIIFLNRAPIIWFSKRQNTVEASTFSSEFIAMKCCVEYITAMRYKLRMFGVPIDEPTNLFCDNESVVKNSSILASTLNKKHSSVAYHSVRWAVAAGIIRVAWIDTKMNLADAMTKRLTVESRNRLFGDWTY